ncbi:hypothetical protein GGP84_003220 [Salinibacter ruber]|uniref:hypothetical protein n=1 Tax=Salinibacter ruber TaxID=146919 RepID=UPI00216A3BEC|nr:hypothetical protein [Salinibacter ruber]MCS3940568.1 hypothetical protein [Salinibacter ruber]
MNTFSMKRVALFLFAGVLSLTVLQTAAAQDANQSHTVDVNVQSITDIIAPGDVTIDISPSNGDFTGTATTSEGYDVTSNAPGDKKVQVKVTNENNVAELNSLKILSAGTSAPGEASAKDVTLVGDGASDGTQDLTTGFTGVDVDNLSVKFEATVSPDFDPTGKNAEVTVQYTLTSTGGGN